MHIRNNIYFMNILQDKEQLFQNTKFPLSNLYNFYPKHNKLVQDKHVVFYWTVFTVIGSILKTNEFLISALIINLHNKQENICKEHKLFFFFLQYLIPIPNFLSYIYICFVFPTATRDKY